METDNPVLHINCSNNVGKLSNASFQSRLSGSRAILLILYGLLFPPFHHILFLSMWNLSISILFYFRVTSFPVKVSSVEILNLLCFSHFEGFSVNPEKKRRIGSVVNRKSHGSHGACNYIGMLNLRNWCKVEDDRICRLHLSPTSREMLEQHLLWRWGRAPSSLYPQVKQPPVQEWRQPPLQAPHLQDPLVAG